MDSVQRPKKDAPTRFRVVLAGAEIRAASGDGGHGVITALHPQRGSVSRVPKNVVPSACRAFSFLPSERPRRASICYNIC